MRLICYNIAYSTGPHKSFWQIFKSWLRFVKPHKNRHNLADIAEYLKKKNADIIALLEVKCVDAAYGANKNQAQIIANSLDYNIISEIKYAPELWHSKMPFLKQQGNALLSKGELNIQNFHYFPFGVKRLIIEIEFNSTAIFVVHLALGQKTRQQQLEHLTKLVKDLHEKSGKSIIIAGDFNAFNGDDEISNLCDELKLKNANTANVKTFPAWAPRHELDFVLHSEDIEVINFKVDNEAKFSDHLPIIIDFERYN
ncbi:endonuclease/exonuclease/phosphatase family protein [Lentisphaerota bacterium WC36G]|nr:endonuclease/exonuclease/phosphatase family protein [Lentisphaerae bacterium WC36]